MEYSEKIAWLRRYREAVRQQELLEMELQRIHAEVWRMGQIITGMPVQHTSCDKIPRSVELMLEQEEFLNKSIAEQLACQKEIQKAIDKVESPILRTILVSRYIAGLTSEQTAQRCCITPRWERELYRRAIARILLNYNTKSCTNC